MITFDAMSVAFKTSVGVIVFPERVLRDTCAGTFFNDVVCGVDSLSEGLTAQPYFQSVQSEAPRRHDS